MAASSLVSIRLPVSSTSSSTSRRRFVAFPLMLPKHGSFAVLAGRSGLLRFPVQPWRRRRRRRGFLSPRGSMMLGEICTGVDGVSDLKSQLQVLFTEIKTKIEKGKKDEAIDLLRANYELVKDQVENGFKGIEQAAILDVVALGYMRVGDFKLVGQLLEMLDEIVGSLHDDIPLMDSILLHMGSMFFALREFEDAFLTYERSLKIVEKNFGKNNPFLIPALMGMAKVLRSTGRTTKAINVYHWALDILEKNRGVKSEELVVPLTSLGNLLMDIDRVAEAEKCFSRILAIYKEAYGESDGRTGMAFWSVAHSLYGQGNVDEAIGSYKRGLQIVKDANYMALDDGVLEKMRVDLAELLHFAGREQEGRELLKESLLINERFKGIRHPRSITQLLNLTSSHSRSKNFIEAERLLRTCLQLLKKSRGPNDQALSVAMLHLAIVLYHRKHDEEAEDLALSSLRIRENLFGAKSRPVGEALDCIVSIQARLGKDDTDILGKLKRLLSIQEKVFGCESEEVMITLKKIVFYMDKMGKRDEKFPFQRRLTVLRNLQRQKDFSLRMQ